MYQHICLRQCILSKKSICNVVTSIWLVRHHTRDFKWRIQSWTALLIQFIETLSHCSYTIVYIKFLNYTSVMAHWRNTVMKKTAILGKKGIKLGEIRNHTISWKIHLGASKPPPHPPNMHVVHSITPTCSCLRCSALLGVQCRQCRKTTTKSLVLRWTKTILISDDLTKCFCSLMKACS